MFNAAVEATFVNYITQMSAIGFGLTPDGVRRLAYQAAEVNNTPVPDNWKKEQKAGRYLDVRKYSSSFIVVCCGILSLSIFFCRKKLVLQIFENAIRN